MSIKGKTISGIKTILYSKLFFVLSLFFVNNISSINNIDLNIKESDDTINLTIINSNNEETLLFNQNYFIDKQVKSSNQIESNIKKSENTYQLFSHGKPGELLIEGKWKNSKDIAVWLKNKNLDQVSHLNIYGCEFAKGEKGKQAVSYLEKTLNVSVAASNNITGYNGDWILEEGIANNVVKVKNYKYNLQSISGTVNSYASVTSISGTVFTVDNAASFSSGDLVLIIQMQGALIDDSDTINYGSVINPRNAGNYELVNISSISGNNITFPALNKSYDSDGSVQIVKVADYSANALTIVNSVVTGDAWDGAKGGVVVLKADVLRLDADIDMSEKGFRGGNPFRTTTQNNYVRVSGGSEKGEGIAKFTAAGNRGKGHIANGGGAGDWTNSGGGGGGNYGSGGNGADIGGDGSELKGGGKKGPSVSDCDVIGDFLPIMGGGGGSGDFNDAFQTRGGNGGGIIFIYANQIIGNGGNLISNGENGIITVNSFGDGAAGGGAGGTVLVESATYSGASVTVNVDGGNASNAWSGHGSAGGGGGGTFFTNGTNMPSGWVLSAKGGLKSAVGDAGATDGQDGGIVDLDRVSVPKVIDNQSFTFDLQTLTANVPFAEILAIIDPSLTEKDWSIATPLFPFSIDSGGNVSLSSLNIYPSTYNLQVTVEDSNSIVSCPLFVQFTFTDSRDSDGDGIGDLVDIDDDNDGILDTTELNCGTGAATTTTANTVLTAGSQHFEGVFNNGASNVDYSVDFTNLSAALVAANISDGASGVHYVIDDTNLGAYSSTITVTPQANALINKLTWGPNLVGNTDAENDNDEQTIVLTWSPAIMATVYDPDDQLDINGVVDGSDTNGVVISTGDSIFQRAEFENASPPTWYVEFNGNFLPSAFELTTNHTALAGVADLRDEGFSLTADICYAVDTDGDTVPNHLDLDSDGDGCSDALEAGATTDTTADFKFNFVSPANDANNNGLADTVENGTTGNINYTSTYYQQAISNILKACADTDGDGIGDLVDIDDDNDGILDTTELNCGTGAATTTTANTVVTAGSQHFEGVFNNGASNVDYSVDFTNLSATLVAANISDGASGVHYVVDDTNLGAYSSTITVTPQTNALINKLTWGPNLVGNADTENDNDEQTIVLTWSPAIMATVYDPDNQLDINGVVDGSDTNGVVISSGDNIFQRAEFENASPPTWYVEFNGNFLPSAFELTTNHTALAGVADLRDEGFSLTADICYAVDTDGDTVPNHLDLDSDGDGCSDALEAGATTDTTTDFKFNFVSPANDANNNGLADTVENGTTGNINYTSTYYQAISNILKACADTDGDGIGDLVDIDDDNDGILDTTELNCGTGAATTTTANTVLTAGSQHFEGVFNNGTSNVDYSVDFTNLSAALVAANISDGASGVHYVVDDTNLGAYSSTITVTPQANTLINKLTWGPNLVGNADTENDNDEQTITLTWSPTITATVYDPDDQLDINGVVDGSDTNGVVISSGDNIFQRAEFENASPPTWYVEFNGNFLPSAFELTTNHTALAGVADLRDEGFSLTADICYAVDTDGDTVPNHLDLDSDGDGCSDALEAGATTDTTTDFKFNFVSPANDANNNGLADTVENGTTGNINYTSTYYQAISNILKACADTDGDGIGDLVDIDDDNDGILDTTELNCGTGAATTTTANTVLTAGSQHFEGVFNNGTSNVDYSVDFTNLSAALVAANISDGASGVHYVVDDTNLGAYSSTITVTPQANTLINKLTWGPNLVGNADTENDNDEQTITLTWSPTITATVYDPDDQLDINGVVDGSDTNGVVISSGDNIFQRAEFENASPPTWYVEFNGNFLPSAFELTTNHTALAGVADLRDEGFSLTADICYAVDTDGDTVPNHLDLDSDGDGCSDALEAGATTDTTTDFKFNFVSPANDANNNGLADTVENGTTGSINYTSTYNAYSINNTIKACTDTDGDGVFDITDLDDDNDGVLDTEECPEEDYTRLLHTQTGSYTINSPSSSTSLEIENGGSLFDYQETTNAMLKTSNTTPTVWTFGTPLNIILRINAANALGEASVNPAEKYVIAIDGIDYTVPTDVLNTYGWIRNSDGSISSDDTPSGSLPALGYEREISIPLDLYSLDVASVPEVSISIKNIGTSHAVVYAIDYAANITCMDTDGDGIPNSLDLDSDGDGCSDALEGGANFVNANLVTDTNIAGGGTNVQTNLGITVDANGVPIIANGGQPKGQSQNNAVSTSCTDTDGDGINDYVDIDDDNDGIIDTEECTAVPNVLDWSTVTWASGTMSNTYTVAGESIVMNVTDTSNALVTSPIAAPGSGQFYQGNQASIDHSLIFAVDLATLSTTNTVSITIDLGTAGTGLENFAFDLFDVDGESGAIARQEEFTIIGSLNGAEVYPILEKQSGGTQVITGNNVKGSNTPAPTSGAGSENGTISAKFGSAVDKVTIVFKIADGSVVNPGSQPGFGLYNLSFGSCTTDTDGDGIPNSLDLDSDGDGCPDAIEGGANFVNADLKTDTNIDGGSTNVQTNLGITVDANGVPVIANGGQTIGESQNSTVSLSCIDTDTDDINDYVDIDDDNDGILDTEERFCSPRQVWDSTISNGTITLVGGETVNYTTTLTGPGTFTGSNDTSGHITMRNGGDNNPPTIWTITFDTPVDFEAFSKASSGAWFDSGEIWVMSSPGATFTVDNPDNSLTLASGVYNNQITFSPSTSGPNSDKLWSIKSNEVMQISISYEKSINNGGTIQIGLNCVSIDTDGDGIPNYLDLDSDGDGCPDAIESGVVGNLINGDVVNGDGTTNTTTDTSNAIAEGPYGNNGLANDLEDVDTTIATTTAAFTSTYTAYALDNATNVCGVAMITQVYQSAGEKWIEITNIDPTNIVAPNAANVALFKDLSGDQSDVVPTAFIANAATIDPGKSVLISAGSVTNKHPDATETVSVNTTDFDTKDDIIVLTRATNNKAYNSRVDIVEEIEDNTSYVRIDEILEPNTTYTASEWVAFIDDTIITYTDLANDNAKERHFHAPLLSEIATANAEANIRPGLHRFNFTDRTGSAWSNGYPDRSRYVKISENYNHTDKLSARKFEVRNNSIFSITDNLLVVTNDINIVATNDEIRLVSTDNTNKAQLVQTHTGTTQVTGSGKLLVDQNSTVPSLYRYNYMGSPVNSDGTNYTIENVFKDGTNPLDATTAIGNGTPNVSKDITFIGGYDGDTTDPISLADYWIYTYAPASNGRSNWEHKYKGGAIKQTDGFIFKGPGIPQNYTFLGTPNDGVLNASTVGANEHYLLGNPFSSALSIKKFIEDNINSTTATLYFWEHAGEEDTSTDTSGHNYAGYIGGYATRNIAMGLSANSPSNVGPFDIILEAEDASTNGTEYNDTQTQQEVTSITISGTTDFVEFDNLIKGVDVLRINYRSDNDKNIKLIVDGLSNSTTYNYTLPSVTDYTTFDIEVCVEAGSDVKLMSDDANVAYIDYLQLQDDDGNISCAPSSGGSNASKVPGAYIPIGQGFFIQGDSDGGPIVFNNSQREYVTEGGNSVFFKGESSIKDSKNADSESRLPIIKLGMDFLNNEGVSIHRQLGISFKTNNSFAFDKGYDSEIYDLSVTDVYWKFPNDDLKYVIAGVQEITDDLEVPFDIVMDYDGSITIQIDEIKAIDREVFIKDNFTNQTYLLNDTIVALQLHKGTHSGRFSLVFTGTTLSIEDNSDSIKENQLSAYIDNKNQEIVILNHKNLEIEKVELFNLLGQRIYQWKSIDTNKTEHRLRIKNLNSQVFIVNINTDKGKYSKKILLKNN